jgi:hypothetical protein
VCIEAGVAIRLLHLTSVSAATLAGLRLYRIAAVWKSRLACFDLLPGARQDFSGIYNLTAACRLQ